MKSATSCRADEGTPSSPMPRAARPDARVLAICGLVRTFAIAIRRDVGRQRQRVESRARSRSIEFIICDEPCPPSRVVQARSSPDRESAPALRLTYLFIVTISRLVRHLCQRIAVMYLAASSSSRIATSCRQRLPSLHPSAPRLVPCRIRAWKPAAVPNAARPGRGNAQLNHRI